MKLNKGFMLFLFCCLCVTLYGQPPIPDPKGNWVVDDANMIGSSTENLIQFAIQNHYGQTTNQIVVYTIAEMYNGSMESYANEVFNEWKIGSKENNNGVLILISLKQLEVRIEVGYGLEEYLTDLECRDIEEHEMLPLMQEGNFDGAIFLGVESVIDAIDGTYQPKPLALKKNPYRIRFGI